MAAALAIIAVILGLQCWHALTRRALRDVYDSGRVRGAAWVRFGRDGVFKDDSGRLEITLDGSVIFTPGRYERRHGARAEVWPAGRVSLRWVGRPRRNLWVGPRYRVLELRHDGAKRQMAAYAVVGELT